MKYEKEVMDSLKAYAQAHPRAQAMDCNACRMNSAWMHSCMGRMEMAMVPLMEGELLAMDMPASQTQAMAAQRNGTLMAYRAMLGQSEQ